MKAIVQNKTILTADHASAYERPPLFHLPRARPAHTGTCGRPMDWGSTAHIAGYGRLCSATQPFLLILKHGS